MPDRINVLFLCTGNSCRSQIAEGWLRELGGESFTVQSAGIEAHGKNPRAIATMHEAGVDISGQESTVVTAGMIAAANVVVDVRGPTITITPPGSIADVDPAAPGFQVDLEVRHTARSSPGHRGKSLTWIRLQVK